MSTAQAWCSPKSWDGSWKHSAWRWRMRSTRCEWQGQRGVMTHAARARAEWQRQVHGPLPPSSFWTFLPSSWGCEFSKMGPGVSYSLNRLGWAQPSGFQIWTQDLTTPSPVVTLSYLVSPSCMFSIHSEFDSRPRAKRRGQYRERFTHLLVPTMDSDSSCNDSNTLFLYGHCYWDNRLWQRTGTHTKNLSASWHLPDVTTCSWLRFHHSTQGVDHLEEARCLSPALREFQVRISGGGPWGASLWGAQMRGCPLLALSQQTSSLSTAAALGLRYISWGIRYPQFTGPKITQWKSPKINSSYIPNALYHTECILSPF